MLSFRQFCQVQTSTPISVSACLWAKFIVLCCTVPRKTQLLLPLPPAGRVLTCMLDCACSLISCKLFFIIVRSRELLHVQHTLGKCERGKSFARSSRRQDVKQIDTESIQSSQVYFECLSFNRLALIHHPRRSTQTPSHTPADRQWESRPILISNIYAIPFYKFAYQILIARGL